MSFNDVVKTLSIGANIAENVTPNGKRATSAGSDYDRTMQKMSARNAATPKHHRDTSLLSAVQTAQNLHERRERRNLNIAIGSAKQNGNTFNRNANLPNLIKRIDVKVGRTRA